MMESCFNEKLERREAVEIDDLRKDLFSEFGALPDSEEPNLVDREHLQVYLRIRPFTATENDTGESQDCVTIDAPDTVLLKPPSLSSSARLSDKSLPQTGQRFQFSKVYGPETTQRELFEGTVKGLVKDVLEGGNSLVFTYGVTNAGKTFTFLGPDVDAGILPRSLNVIFGSIEERVYTQMSIKPQRCREFVRLTKEQQVEEAVCKRNLFRQLKESDKTSASQLCSTSRTTFEGSSLLGVSVVNEDTISLDVDAHTKFSVWVSFCEIYNENIHDLLEPLPSGALRRAALRLSQDVKGNSFVKDLRWVQVNNAEEAYRVMKLGKRNQSFSSTRLNQLSSRSHSIFSIRVMRIEDTGIPRVHAISELSLCDLAGSERCAKTQNKGERLKEAGNINTSLLILGKCINALRHNQQAKLVQHVPFRESKLTHFLQGYFCGRGKACMLVNINQCASMFDETLNVLKFSAVAQKVVVLTARARPNVAQRAAREVSFIINNADRKLLQRRKSSLIGWDSSLEDVQEDDDDDDDCDEEDSLMEEDTMQESGNEEEGVDDEDKVVLSKEFYQRQVALLSELQVQLKKEQAENMVLEARIREEVSKEFSELFSEMQTDYNDRLAREKEILEERAEKRIEILKNLYSKMTGSSPADPAMDKSLDLGDMINSMSTDLAGIKQAAQDAHTCLGDNEQTQPSEELEKTQKALESRELKLTELMVICQEKDQMISKLQTTMDKQVEDATRNKEMLDTIREEIVLLKTSCTCSRAGGGGAKRSPSSRSEALKRKEEPHPDLEGRPPSKKDFLSEAEGRDEAMDRLGSQLQEKSSEVVRLERRVLDLERELEAQGPREEAAALRMQLQELTLALGEAKQGQEEAQRAHKEALAALEREEKARDQALAALEYQTAGKEEALSCLEEERRAREEASAALGEQQRRHQEGLAALTEARRAEGEAVAALREEEQRKEQALASLAEERRAREEVQSALVRVTEEGASLQEANGDLTCRLESAQAETARADDASNNLQGARVQLEKRTQELQEQSLRLHCLTEEVQRLKQEEQGASRDEADQLRARLQGGTEAWARQEEELRRKLREQEVTSQQQLEELKRTLGEQQAAAANAAQERGHLEQKLCQQEHAAGQLGAQLEESRSNNSDLQAEVASLREKLSLALSSAPTRLAETERSAAEKGEELGRKLAEQEAQVSSLQKKLQEAQERREEEESQAVQEARRREVERRRELLAVAEEAIAQKDEELEKRAQEISRLKESARQDADTVKAVTVELQRKEDDTLDLREKLADSKKQIQQVQKEVTAMREQERGINQKLANAEKSMKQLQSDLAGRDRIIQQLKKEHSLDSNSEPTLKHYQKVCKDLEDKESILDAMRLTLTEQEETQEQMDLALQEKCDRVQELVGEVEKLKGTLQGQGGGIALPPQSDSQSDDLKMAKQEVAKVQESLKLSTEKHQADRKKWLEEKASLIGQAKEAESKRNQEVRKFAEERERHAKQQSQLASLSAQLVEREQTLQQWKKDRDALVSALEVQLKKLLSSSAEKDHVISQLRCAATQPPQESAALSELHSALAERDAQILRLKEQLNISAPKSTDASRQQTPTQTQTEVNPAGVGVKPQVSTGNRKSADQRDPRGSVSSRGSSGCPSVLESSSISTEHGRTSRFPKPELEISFSPLQPNRMALRRQGQEGCVTVKITRSARKRKSGEMDKTISFGRRKRRPTEDEVEAENRKNTKTRLTAKMAPQKDKGSSLAGNHGSPSSGRSRKEGPLQKIGEFLHSSPTLLGTKAKKMMGLVSGWDDASSSSSSSLSRHSKKTKRKLYRPEISSPIDMPSHPIISREPEEKESDHLIIKRRLRTRTAK